MIIAHKTVKYIHQPTELCIAPTNLMFCSLRRWILTRPSGAQDDEREGTGAQDDERKGTGDQDDERKGTGAQDDGTGKKSAQDDGAGKKNPQDDGAGQKSPQDDVAEGTRAAAHPSWHLGETASYAKISDNNTKHAIKMNEILTSATIETPLDTMTAVASPQALHFLHFPDTQDHATIKNWIAEGRIQPQTTAHPCLDQLKKELAAYFEGKLKTFQTPLHTSGTPFQQHVWKALQTVQYGHTISYQTEARKIKRPTAYRAVANANGANPITLIIPCHRIIRHDGSLGGYGAGIHRKQWLLDHEKAHA